MTDLGPSGWHTWGQGGWGQQSQGRRSGSFSPSWTSSPHPTLTSNQFKLFNTFYTAFFIACPKRKLIFLKKPTKELDILCVKNNLNLRIKTEPVTAGAEAMVYLDIWLVQYLFTCIWPRNRHIPFFPDSNTYATVYVWHLLTCIWPRNLITYLPLYLLQSWQARFFKAEIPIIFGTVLNYSTCRWQIFFLHAGTT